jgi:hypothetical protein
MLFLVGQSDACSSANIAHDPLCLLNSSTPICVTWFSNPWIYNCRFEILFYKLFWFQFV